MKPYFSLFGNKIPFYGTLIVCAYFIGIWIATKVAKKYKIPNQDILFAGIYAAIGLIVGAKILYFIAMLPKLLPHFDLLWKEPLLFLEVGFGGYVFYGGLLGAGLGVFIYCKRYKIPLLPMINILTPAVPFIHSIGRIGCFMAGCCYGIEYHGPLSIHFPYNEISPELNLVPRFPIQLVESALVMLLFIVLMLYERKLRKDCKVLGIYLICYALLRFTLEFLRGDIIRGQFFGVTTSQWVSLLLLPVGIFLFVKKFKEVEEKKNKEE